jgi:hypothetical protein
LLVFIKVARQRKWLIFWMLPLLGYSIRLTSFGVFDAATYNRVLFHSLPKQHSDTEYIMEKQLLTILDNEHSRK